jgi:hypothetical protein
LRVDGTQRANVKVQERFAGSSGFVVQRCSFRTTLVTRSLDGSGSFAFPAPRSSLPVARLNLRGFPWSHRLLPTSLRSFAEARPSWASLLSRTERHRCLPVPSAPVGDFPTTSLEIRQGCCSPDSLSSTSSPASAFPWCCHHFGFEQQARIAFRPCRFARLRRVSPPIARVFTGLFVTVQGDEGLADLLRSAANRRVRCVSFTHPVEPAPETSPLLTVSLAGHSDSCFPASTFVPPGGFPPPAARCVATPLEARRRAPCPLGLCVSSDLDRPDEAVSSFTVLAVSEGHRPSRRCSASGSVPSHVL